MARITGYITYKGKKYPTIEIDINGQSMTVCTEELGNIISNLATENGGKGYDTETRYIDEQIYCFIDEQEMRSLTKKELTKGIKEMTT